MDTLTFLFMNSIVAVSSFLATYRLFKIPNLVDSLIAWFVLYFAQIVFNELILGILGILYLKNIIFLNLLILIFLWKLSRKFSSTFNLGQAKSILPRIFENKVILLGACLIFGFGLVKIFGSLVNPPFGWDSLNYHFTFPVEWLKHGNLNNPIVVSDDPFPSYYPINGSLLFLWLILPFKNAFLADLGQLPFFIISFLAILSIGKKLRLNREYSFFAAALFIMIPNLFKQLGIGYVDIMMCGIFLAALNFLLGIKEEFNKNNLIFFALAFGLFIGIKTTALTYSIFILLPFLYFIFSNKQANLKVKTGYIIMFVFLIFTFGCFSYFKNLISTGNPFYPLEINIFGRNLFKGVIDKATFISRNETGGYSLAKLLFHEGLGIQSLLVILPATIFALPVNLFKNKNKDLFLNYIMILPLLLYLCYRLVLPIPNSRYLYPMLAVGAIAGFFILNSLKGIPKIIINVIVAIFFIASAGECARKLELSISFGLSLFLFVTFILSLKYKILRNVLLSKTAIVSVFFISIMLLQILLLDYRKNEYTRYAKNSRYWPDATASWAWLNKNTQGNNIAYVGRPVPYPLYGTDLKNNVYYVSINRVDPILLHDLKNSKYRWDGAESMHISFEEKNNYRGNADYSVWLDNLYRRKTDFLFIYSLHHTKDIEFPVEEIWASAHPDKFNLVFSNNTIRIYKLIK